MDLKKTLQLASHILDDASVRHALIGGLALAAHGINRATADVDVLADGAQRDLILQSLLAAGFQLTFSSAEVLQFTGVGQVDVLLANRPMSLRMINEATRFDRLPIKVLRVEDLIGLKIQAFQNDRTRELKDKADIQALMIAHPSLDWNRVKSYADLFGEWSTIENLRKIK